MASPVLTRLPLLLLLLLLLLWWSAGPGLFLTVAAATVPDFVATPSNYNCEPMNDDFQVRWQVDGDNLNVELLGRIDDGVYMSFGVSGTDTETEMVGCDAVVADLFNEEYRVIDYYMSSKSPCIQGSGVCVDGTDNSLTSDVSNVSGSQEAGLTIIKYTRPLIPVDVNSPISGIPTDRPIPVESGVSTFIVWALGLSDADSGVPLFHSIGYPTDDVSLEFGRSVVDNCVPLLAATEETPVASVENLPFFRPILSNVTQFTARVGPNGGERGYTAITGENADDVSWYINDFIIPVIEMRRGTTYRFLVNGGNDATSASEYHPLYLTDSSEGGFAQVFPDQTETVYAGIQISSDGSNYTATAQGPLCLYDETTATADALLESFQDYFETLNSSCADDTTISAAAGVMEFTPDESTPDELYYQSVTQPSVGWEIHVIDADAPSSLLVDCSSLGLSPVTLTSGVTLDAIINPNSNTLTARLVYEGQAWLSLAFTEDQGLMIGGQAVIGLPDISSTQTNPGKYDLNSYTTAGVVLMPDSQQTLIDSSIEQNMTHTVLTFTKLLNEVGEHPIRSERSNTMLWAIGRENTLGMHASRGSIQLQPAQCAVTYKGVILNANLIGQVPVEVEADKNRGLWIAHGVCASFAWAILVPLAIGSSVIRNTLHSIGLSKGAWYQLHRGLNMVALLLTVIAFGIAVYIIGQTPNAKHFSNGTHKVAGLVILIFTLVQAIGAIFRPHLPTVHKSVDNTAESESSDINIEEQNQPTESVAKKSVVRVAWEYGHRIFGVGLLVFSWWQVQNGLRIYSMRYGVTSLTGVFWAVVAAICVVVIAVKTVEHLRKDRSLDSNSDATAGKAVDVSQEPEPEKDTESVGA